MTGVPAPDAAGVMAGGSVADGRGSAYCDAGPIVATVMGQANPFLMAQCASLGPPRVPARGRSLRVSAPRRRPNNTQVRKAATCASKAPDRVRVAARGRRAAATTDAAGAHASSSHSSSVPAVSPPVDPA